MKKSIEISTVYAGLALILMAALSGCSGAREAFGLNKSAPDEFAVVTRAPLSMPPDYGLRPPTPGAVRPQENSPQNAARNILLNSAVRTPRTGANNGFSRGEAALLGRAGARNVDPSIREKVSRENSVLAAEGNGLIDSLLFWQDDEIPGTVLDPERESRRLRENAALGDPVTKGATPTIQRKEKGLLEGLFN